MQEQQQQFDIKAFTDHLVEQIRQPASPKIPKEPTWAEKKLGTPKSFEEVLWRLCWLMVVPGIITIVLLPCLIWLYHNYYPWASLLILSSICVGYYLFYLFNAGSGKNKQQRLLIDIQLATPPGVFAFMCFYSLLKPH